MFLTQLYDSWVSMVCFCTVYGLQLARDGAVSYGLEDKSYKQHLYWRQLALSSHSTSWMVWYTQQWTTVTSDGLRSKQKSDVNKLILRKL